MRLERSGPWIGTAGLLVVLWLVVSTVLYAPWWGVVLHLLVLVCFVPVLARRARTAPETCVLVPVAALVAWVVVNVVGVTLLGWRA